MGPPAKGVRPISQEAFDDLVRENMEDLGMDPAEALQDAIDTLTLQGVDLSGTISPFAIVPECELMDKVHCSGFTLFSNSKGLSFVSLVMVVASMLVSCSDSVCKRIQKSHL